MMKRTKQTAPMTSQVRELGPSQSFLDVLREICDRDGRYTLSVVTDGAEYTVLVDRGGPFNAIGGGTAGSPALVRAAQVRSGQCTITIGWPVDQPVYQPGLDITLKGLVEGVVEASSLPRHRGVDSLRNAEWRDAGVAIPAPRPEPPKAPVASAAPNEPYAPAPVRRQVMLPVPPAAPPAAAEAPASAAAEAPVVTQAPPVPAPEPKMVWKQVGSRDVWTAETELPVTFKEPTPKAATPRPETEAPAGAREKARQMATNALLWLVEAEDREGVTLEEAAAMARRGLVDGLMEGVSSAFHPLKKDLGKRVDRIRDDWEKSGEVAKKARRKKAARKLREDDPDAEFRL